MVRKLNGVRVPGDDAVLLLLSRCPVEGVVGVGGGEAEVGAVVVGFHLVVDAYCNAVALGEGIFGDGGGGAGAGVGGVLAGVAGGKEGGAEAEGIGGGGASVGGVGGVGAGGGKQGGGEHEGGAVGEAAEAGVCGGFHICCGLWGEYGGSI